MKRITFEEVEAAVEKTGIRLKQCSFGNGVDCGCPQTALYVAAGNKLPEHASPSAVAAAVDCWADETYALDYAAGFRNGFDSPGTGYHGSEAYNTGRLDGTTCYEKALKKELLFTH